MVSLTVHTRDKKENVEKARKGGMIPAVLYGPKEESMSVFISEKDFEKVWREAGESTVVVLEGLDEQKEALIHDVDLEPVSDVPRHADFYVFEKGKKVEVAVPLAFVGEAPAVTEKGGLLVKVLHELEIEALPKDLPHEIPVDISGMTELDSHIMVKDLTLPSGVIVKMEPDEIVASITEYKEEEEAPVEIDMEAIEVEGKGKGEEKASGRAEGGAEHTEK